MSGMLANHKISVVTALLPQGTTDQVIERVFSEGDPSVLLVNARGSLVKDSWYKAMLPLVSPEKSNLQFMVPDPEVDHIMEEIVTSAKLHLPGSGAVFSVPCDEFWHSEDFVVWSGGADLADAPDASHNLKENLTAIFCITQPEQSEAVTRAAMRAGAHGPIIYYCEGSGLRDRLGWLKITKKPTKEVMVLVVDNADADAVVGAMVAAGRIDAPGRGFLYRMPVQKGLISIASTYGARQQMASMQQIVGAIDRLHGGASWRAQNVFEGADAKSAGLDLHGKLRKRRFLERQVMLSCVVKRKFSSEVIAAALKAGAPGANVCQAKFIEGAGERTRQGVRINVERGIVQVVIPADRALAVRTAVKEIIESRSMNNACLYIQPVTRAYTYFQEKQQQ